MSTHVRSVLAGVFLCSALAGCKDDPPPPPPTVGAVTEGSAAPGDKSAGVRTDAKVQRVDPETTKVLRAGACYWGTMGVAVTRDAYLASTKDGELSADKLPNFGDFPEHQKQEEARKKAGREPLARIGQNLPYLRHLRACQHAKSQQAPLEGLDPALAEYEKYVTELHDVFVKATRYYARKAYEKDEFKEGKEIDAKLKELLPQFDEKRAAFAAAYAAWHDKNKEWMPKDELDAAGKIGQQAVVKAHDAVVLLMADKPDKEALGKAVEELKKLEADLQAADDPEKRAAHPRTLKAPLAEVIAAIEAARAVEGKLTPAQLYPAQAAVAVLFDLHQRAIEQTLRQKSGGKRGPMKVLNPNQRTREPIEGHERQRGIQVNPQ